LDFDPDIARRRSGNMKSWIALIGLAAVLSCGSVSAQAPATPAAPAAPEAAAAAPATTQTTPTYRARGFRGKNVGLRAKLRAKFNKN
jgi:hypothetical protein